ncbi:hypothetical protein TNCV_1430431 [Trichonephila clavipes]|nr:hypothetical protein TNCV_1430431 [Trichonephila clavipes]
MYVAQQKRRLSTPALKVTSAVDRVSLSLREPSHRPDLYYSTPIFIQNSGLRAIDNLRMVMDFDQTTRTTTELVAHSSNFPKPSTGRLRAWTDLTCTNPNTGCFKVTHIHMVILVA